MKSVINKHFYQQGYNLIELLVVLVIASFLMGYALPSYQSMIEKQSQRSELARLQAVLNHARIMASLNDQPLIICPSEKGNKCDSSANEQGNLLLLTAATNQPVFFSSGAGFKIIFPSQDLKVYPLPSQNSGGTLLPCTGFTNNKPKGLVVSPTGRVRVSDEIDKSYSSRCTN
ncbi:pilus assembly FimT family protein [Marinospirillum insulare]|uniref:Type IV fimbrial biogenesis protein FimT n=1 Tax=Marinospirillum insulare TaxID=217169 RepID=A0ABQ6A4L2_9GAMM|nr:prepilin-type N-terminal cleavage/methylation domain-containing protein [Marinospirillum insulare]GLR65133.1 hypothetical protein GCM10007878_25720 [Marinospirillum insulare]